MTLELLSLAEWNTDMKKESYEILMVLVDRECVAVGYWGYVTPTQNNCLCSS